MVKTANIDSQIRNSMLPTFWCPGCGHGIVVKSALRAVAGLGLNNDDVVAVSGIGCHARSPAYCDYNGVSTTHGRAIAFATGVKMHRPELNVFLFMGDGDCAAIGGNHFLHAAKRNIDLTVIVMNNYIYGMTGGQVSPTTPFAGISTTTPFGNAEPQLDICAVAQAAGATFVARSTAYHANQLVNYIERGIKNQGFSVIECMEPCPTGFGRKNKYPTPVAMYEWLRDVAVPVAKAAKMSEEELEGKIVTGILREKTRPEFGDEYRKMSLRAREIGKKEIDTLEVMEDPTGSEVLEQKEVRISGSGGQGVVLAGIMLAEAAIRQGKTAVQSQSYGPEARGGAARSEVVISNREINFPEVQDPDILLAMTQQALEKFVGSVKPGGLILADTTYVETLPEASNHIYSYPITRVAVEKFGEQMIANVLALGMLSRLSGLVSLEALEKAVLSRVPAKAAELNIKALKEGYDLAAQLKS